MHERPTELHRADMPARRPRRARLLGLGASALASSALVGVGIATGRAAESSSQPTVVLRSMTDEETVREPEAPAFAVDRAATTVPAAALGAQTSEETRVFDGRPVRAVRTVRMKVTAYSPDERSCGAHADGITASGYSVETNGGALVAADPRVLPLGSLVSVPGYDGGAVVPVLDVGGAIKGARLDVLFSTHERAIQWGVQELEVTVWEYADGAPSGFKRQRRPSR